MRQKKKPTSLNDILKIKVDSKELKKREYNRLIKELNTGNANETAMAEKLGIKVGKYSMRTRIKNNPWLKNGRPANMALRWLYKEVFKNPQRYKHNQMYMYSGGLFTFEYFDPKYKDTPSLPWFDKFPLVLSLGVTSTKQGLRNIGFNLHLVPPKIRIIIVCQVFEIYKSLYRYQIFFKRNKPVAINYRLILKSLQRYGVDFCVRMYIPNRQQSIVNFPYDDWYKAVFVPSRAYDSIKADKLIKLWAQHVRKNGYSTQPNIDWLSHV